MWCCLIVYIRCFELDWFDIEMWKEIGIKLIILLVARPDTQFKYSKQDWIHLRKEVKRWTHNIPTDDWVRRPRLWNGAVTAIHLLRISSKYLEERKITRRSLHVVRFVKQTTTATGAKREYWENQVRLSEFTNFEAQKFGNFEDFVCWTKWIQ